jgi:hypothetical protein
MVSLTVKANTPHPTYIRDDMAVWHGNMACDGSYPTGGYSMPSTFNIKQNFKTVTRVTGQPKLGYSFDYDFINNKMLVYTAQMEVMNGGDIDFLSDIRVTAEGFR